MGQKSNLITLRSEQKNLNLNLINSKNFIKLFQFLFFWRALLKIKGLFISTMTFHIVTNICYLNLTVFYGLNKLLTYKKKKKTSRQLCLNPTNLQLNNFGINKIFFNVLKSEKINLINFSIKNLNKLINLKLIKFFYDKLKRFRTNLFIRRFRLFIDFIKLTTLFYTNKLSLIPYLQILGVIFKTLTKKTFNRFIFFLKYLFKLLIFDTFKITAFSPIPILGIKFRLNGKLTRKPRATSRMIQMGVVPIQAFAKNVMFAKEHVYTLTGAFGFRIWVYKKE